MNFGMTTGIGIGAHMGCGPRGVFSPAAFSNLALWLDAADSSTLYDAVSGGNVVIADGSVARWQDKSGNGRHAVQATGGNRPQRKVANQNGKDNLFFDGSSEFMQISSWPNLGGSATGFIVFRPASGGSFTQNSLWDFGTRGDSAYWAYINGVIYDGFGITDRISIAGPYDMSFRNVMASVVIDSSTYKSWLNGAELVESTPVTSAWPATALIGSSAGGGVFGGTIGEIIIYSSALTNGNRVIVQNYLASKWGITF